LDEVTIWYQAVTSIDEMCLALSLTTMLANLLAIIAGSSLQDPTQCCVSIFVDRVVGNDVSAVLAIIRLEAVLN